MIICPSAHGVLRRPQIAVSGVTWNPSDTDGTIVLSNGNLTATGSGTISFGLVRATSSFSTGKWYFELSLDSKSGGSSDPYMGIKLLSDTLSSGDAGPFGSGSEYGVFMRSPNDGFEEYQPGSNIAAVSPAWANGDLFMFAVDMNAHLIWIGRNGTWDSSGDPAAGTGARASITAGTYAPFCAPIDTSVVTAHFASSDFVHAAPTGFVQLT